MNKFYTLVNKLSLWGAYLSALLLISLVVLILVEIFIRYFFDIVITSYSIHYTKLYDWIWPEKSIKTAMLLQSITFMKNFCSSKTEWTLPRAEPWRNKDTGSWNHFWKSFTGSGMVSPDCCHRTADRWQDLFELPELPQSVWPPP